MWAGILGAHLLLSAMPRFLSKSFDPHWRYELLYGNGGNLNEYVQHTSSLYIYYPCFFLSLGSCESDAERVATGQ